MNATLTPTDPSKAFPIYPAKSTGRYIQVTFTVFSILLLILTACAVIAAEQEPNVQHRGILLLAFAWAFLPPLWAWVEFFFVFPRWGRPEAVDSLKDGQKVSLAIWAPIALSLAGYGSSDYFKPEHKEACQSAISIPASKPSAAIDGVTDVDPAQ